MRQAFARLLRVLQQAACQLSVVPAKLSILIVRCWVIACCVLVLSLLLLTVFGTLLAVAMPLRQGVEGLHAAAFVYPFALAGDGALLGLFHHRLGLCDGVVESAQECLKIAPGIAADAVAQGNDESLVIFGAVLLKQYQSRAGLLFAGQQYAKLARGIVHAQLRQFEQGLQWKGFGHGVLQGNLVSVILRHRREYLIEFDQAFGVISTFVQILLQESFQLRLQVDCLVKHRIGAGGVCAY